MIAFVRGAVASVSTDNVVIDVGGVGLSLQVPIPTAARLRPGESVQLETSLIIRDDAWSLFGFDDAEAKATFELLQSVGGIGPRIAAAVLSVHTPDSLRRAIADDDLNSLVRVPGIGRKGAARIVLELRDKIGAPTSPVTATNSGATGMRDTLVSGLVGLGWPARDAEQAADTVLDAAAGEPITVAAAMKSALQHLARG